MEEITAKKIQSICLVLMNHKGIRKLKEPVEYINKSGDELVNNSLDVYCTVESIFADAGENTPEEKLKFFYDKLFEFYGSKKNEINLPLAA
ncbi:MAG: hypothetical protein ACYCSB_01250 [bacterium]|jgi:hypothetical protein